MDLLPSTLTEVRVPHDRLEEAAEWYGSRLGSSVVVVPRWEGDDQAAMVQVEAVDAIAAANQLGAAGARLRWITESRTYFQFELTDAFSSRWLIREKCAAGPDHRRHAVRTFAQGKSVGLRRLFVQPPPGLMRNWGPGPLMESTVLWGRLNPPASLGLPHYEEYDSYRTTGEPWWYWSFASAERQKVVVMFSSLGLHGQIYAEPADPDLALRLLGLPADGWEEGRQLRGEFRVMRQDDNGNVFVVSSHLSRWDATQTLARLEAAGHKQRYWIEDVA